MRKNVLKAADELEVNAFKDAKRSFQFKSEPKLESNDTKISNFQNWRRPVERGFNLSFQNSELEPPIETIFTPDPAQPQLFLSLTPKPKAPKERERAAAPSLRSEATEQRGTSGTISPISSPTTVAEATDQRQHLNRNSSFCNRTYTKR